MHDLADDLLTGTVEIGKAINKTPRQTVYLLEKGLMPGFKIGRIWHARRSTLRAWIEEHERRALAATAA